MSPILYKKTKSLLFDTDLLGTRLTLGIAELLWAITLAAPGNTFDRITYQEMALVFSEQQWAAIFLISGITQITIALTSITEHWFQKVFAGWNVALWVFIVGSMYISVWPIPAAISGEAALAIASFWIWLRPIILAKGEAYARKSVGTGD